MFTYYFVYYEFATLNFSYQLTALYFQWFCLRNYPPNNGEFPYRYFYNLFTALSPHPSTFNFNFLPWFSSGYPSPFNCRTQPPQKALFSPRLFFYHFTHPSLNF